MSTISIIGAGGMAAAIGGLAAKAGHTVEVMSRDAAKAPLIDAPSQGCTTATVIGPCFCAALMSCSYLSCLAEGTSLGVRTIASCSIFTILMRTSALHDGQGKSCPFPRH